MVGGWWNVALLIVAVVGSLVLWDCQASNGRSSCSKPNITRLNFMYFVSILNGSNRTLSCEIHSDTPLKGAPIWRRVSSSLPDGHSVVNSSCSFSTNTICVMSNLTLIHVVRGHYEGNYTLTAENDCGKASVYVKVNIMVPPPCGSDYNKPPELLKPPPLIVLAVQGGSVTIKAEYKGNINDPNLLAYWCVTTLDDNHCIFPTDNDTSYNVTTIHSCPPTDPGCCYFTTAIEIKSLTLDLSQANLTSAAIWLQNPKSFNPGNTTLVVNVFPTLDKWLPSPNNSVEIDEGQSTEFMCVYNASTDPIITMTTWKFEEDYLEHNTSHHIMTTEYGTDPANVNRVLSKFILSNVGLGNAGTYTCRCVYNRDIIYSKEPVYSGAESFHVKVKPRAKSGHTPYVKIVVAVGVIAIVVICVISFTILIWRRLKTHKALERASNEADQSNGDLDHNANENGHTNGESGHDNGQSNGQSSNDSDQNSDDENAQLLGKNEQCRPIAMMEYPPPADHVTGKPPKSYGGVNDTIRKVINSPKKKRLKRRNLGAARYTSQGDSEDQLLSGQECSDISKGGLIPSHQKTNHQDGEMIPGTINPDTTNTATATGVTSRIIEADGPTAITTVPTGIKQPSIPYGNICPPNTEPDTKGARDSGQLPTKPLLRDPLPSDRPIESDAGRPKLSGGNELSLDESEGPQNPPPAEDTQRNESEFEQAARLQESEIPVTDLLCTNNRTDPSGTSEPCVEHDGERSKAPEPLNMPLTRIPTEDLIESEREVPNTSLPAKCAAPTGGKDMIKLSESESESRPPTHTAPTTERVTTASVLDYGDILNSIAPDLLDVNMETLLSYLQKHHLVTRDEEHHLTIMLHSSVVKSQLLLGYLKHKGRESLQKFLCSLNLARDHIGHEGIADKLKKAMQVNGIDCDDFCSDCCKKS